MGSEDANVNGNALDNTITGNDGENEIVGGAGSDAIDAGGGGDSIIYPQQTDLTATESVDGGDQSDTVQYADADGGTLVLNSHMTGIETHAVDDLRRRT